MSHADTLRGMASDERILAGRENARSTAPLAGADALEAIEEIRRALNWADREYPELLPDEWRAADGWQRGTSHAAQEIIGRIKDALGDTQ